VKSRPDIRATALWRIGADGPRIEPIGGDITHLDCGATNKAVESSALFSFAILKAGS
jgi:hypothetical protein